MFSDKTFELLIALKTEEDYAYVSKRKPEFERELIRPFKSVVADVWATLPDEMKLRLTDKRCFGQIQKQPISQGPNKGKMKSHPFYWAAFYPKEFSKKQAGCQLLTFISGDYLEFGFFFGWQSYDEENEKVCDRFVMNTTYARSGLFLEDLVPYLNKRVPPKTITYRADDYRFQRDGTAVNNDGQNFSWSHFFQNPWQPVANGKYLQIRSPMRVVCAKAVQRMSRDELIGEIVAVFRAMFPLVLMTVSRSAFDEITDWIFADD